MAGRGSFIESFPLFGYDLRDYHTLFSEKLDLLLRLRSSEVVAWNGRLRAAIDGRGVYPRPLQDPLPVWVAVGGTPDSAARAGRLGLPMALAIIGGVPERFARFVDVYRTAGERAGHAASQLRLGINSHGYIADDSQRAADELFPAYAHVMNAIGRERGWPTMGHDDFEQQRALRGALFVGSPQQVVDKILFQHEVFRHDRFLLQISVGTLPHAGVMRAIELFGTHVAPAVRKALS
jgi:alkanesulfonate monooxygenase SsuD/methylene tetrahydromethanopterin reductase-like flavin-dependent oxidoreductase (luciferase family)